MDTASELELAKIHLEAEKLAFQREQATAQNEDKRRDFWKWVVISVLIPIVPALVAYIEHRATSSVISDAKESVEKKVAVVEDKADKAAVKAEAAADKASEVNKSATSTNAITTKWWAERTGNPEDMNEAKEAERKLEVINSTPEPVKTAEALKPR